MPTAIKRQRPILVTLTVAALIAAGVYGQTFVTRAAARVLRELRGTKTLDERLREYGPSARARLAHLFRAGNIPYPPSKVVLAAFKAEKRIDLYAGSEPDIRFMKSYKILAASGVLGPKLREGDMQVPEGLYSVESLNPNSIFHLSMRLSYPSEFEREMAKQDNRTALGGNIMVHGGASSVGCIAIGDPAIEELFVLAADIGVPAMEVIISPVDFRERDIPMQMHSGHWTELLYARLRSLVTALPRRP